MRPDRLVYRHVPSSLSPRRPALLPVDLVDVLLLVPCFSDCPVEALEELLQGLPGSSYKHRQRLVSIGGGRSAAYRTDPPDRDIAAAFHQRVDVVEARRLLPFTHRLSGERQRSAAGGAGPLKRFVIRRRHADRRQGRTETRSSSPTGRTSRTFSVSSAAVRPDAVTNSTSSPSGS